MSVTIGHASKDENSSYRGGTAGDQTSKEVCTRTWWNQGWNVVLRPNSSTVAEKMAAFCEAICKNDNVGYDQYERNTLRTAAKAAGWDGSKVAKCETDCAAFMCVCAEAAGVDATSLYSGGNAACTSWMAGWFTKTGAFTALRDSKYLTSDAYLKRGDILVDEDAHTVMVLSNGANAGSSTTTTSSSTTTTTTKSLKAKESFNVVCQLIEDGYSADVEYIKAWQGICNALGFTGKNGKALTKDGETGEQTTYATKQLQTKAGITADGAAGKTTWLAALKMFGN